MNAYRALTGSWFALGLLIGGLWGNSLVWAEPGSKKGEEWPYQFTLQKNTPSGTEEVNLLLSQDGKKAVFTRNSNFDSPGAYRVLLGKFEALSDPNILAEAPTLRMAAQKFSGTDSNLLDLSDSFQASSQVFLQSPHDPKFLVNGRDLQTISSPLGELARKSFDRLIAKANWRAVDSIQVDFAPPAPGSESPVLKVKRVGPGIEPKNGKCADLGFTLSGKNLWRCTVPLYGIAEFVSQLPKSKSAEVRKLKIPNRKKGDS